MANSIKPQIEAKQLHLFFDLSEDITLKTDKYLLSQMVLNLLTNAVRYTDEGEVLPFPVNVCKRALL
ncbi:hypothetical protein ABG809_08045 [Streptococcus iniae]